MTTDELEAIRERAKILGIRSPAAAGLSIDIGTLLAEIATLTASLADCRACRERLLAAERDRLEQENAGLREGR